MSLERALLEILKAKTPKGRLNKAIDLLCHPHFPEPFYVALDTLLHYQVEKDNPEEFWRKFAKHNLKYFLQKPKRKLSKGDLDRIALLILARELKRAKHAG